MSPWSYRPLVDFSVLGRALEEGRPESAVTTLDKALALWRGPAYAEFQATPFGQAEGRRLEELRLSATEDRWAAALEQGLLTAAIPELERLLVNHPLRERLWSLLMLALYQGSVVVHRAAPVAVVVPVLDRGSRRTERETCRALRTRTWLSLGSRVRDGAMPRGERCLLDALALRRDPALADLSAEPFVGIAVRQLEESSLGAVKELGAGTADGGGRP